MNRVREAGTTGTLLITHYTRILRYIEPDFVHVFVQGQIAEEGGRDLAQRLEDEGYERYGSAARQPVGAPAGGSALPKNTIFPGIAGMGE